MKRSDHTKSKRRWLRATRSEEGSATLEFALMFPLAATFFLASTEVAVHMAYQALFDRGVDLTVREVRLGQFSDLSSEGLGARICENAGMLLTECDSRMAVALIRAGHALDIMREYEEFGSIVFEPQCVTRNVDGDLVPPTLWTSNRIYSEDYVFMSVCYKMDPFFPTTAFGRDLDEEGTYRIKAFNSFVTEPMQF